MITLRILRGELILDHFSEPLMITEALGSEGGGQRDRCDWSERFCVSGFEDGGNRPLAKEWEGPLEAGKARKPPPEPPEGRQSCSHLLK